jgi:hypothetical protein
MERTELEELHYIAPIANVPSILASGIRSHNAMKRTPHVTIAMAKIQERRAKVKVPGGRPLHDYVNLYFNARNPMMYKRRHEHAALAVLRVAAGVLDLPGVVITSGNASSGYTRFAAGPGGLTIVESDLVFAKSWLSGDEIEYYRRKQAICAEVLIPDSLDPKHILGAYVSGQEAAEELKRTAPGLAISVRPELFFLE